MKKEMLKERIELLAIGEAIGYPRLGIGRSNGRKLSIRAGQSNWEQFCGHAHTTRIPAALRIGRILRDNGIKPYNPAASQTILLPVTVTASTSEATYTVAQPVIVLDDPIEEMVRPKKSAAALRQARWREKHKKGKG